IDGGMAINYDENNSTLRGNNDDPPNGESYVFVEGIAIDRNYLYAVCYRAVNGYPVAIADLTRLDDPSGWDSLGIDDGLTTAFVRSVDYYAGHLAVGTDRDPGGVFLCQVGYDPFNRLSNACVHFTEDNSYLLSDVVRVVRFSPDGILWVGTNSGLSQYDPGYERFIDIELPAGIDLDVTDLEFDRRGNLWIGTRKGLARMDATTGGFEVFSTLNSDLVDDGINSLNIDPFTGKLYVATNFGISILSTTVGRPVFDVDRVVAIPNPFVIRSDNDRLEFNFSEKVNVRIYSIAGELIREMDTNTLWGGRNQQGEKVASGVYIYVLIDKTGNLGRGKILLVRE
ncbi:MAG: two-component regulator propeller domain-containing protein, partial [candidate division Zixibacteria bacterium]|nr:two-component regulator propeller domain-containing protein [candidate division Zixibacteria bacterium]